MAMGGSRFYIGGTFDLTHAGHYELFRKLKVVFGGRVIVSLNTDAFAARYKRKPILTLKERARAVGACKWVDDVITNWGDENSKPAILLSGATHIVHGNDWPPDDLKRQMGLTDAWLTDHGIDLLLVPYTQGISTSQVIERCRLSQP